MSNTKITPEFTFQLFPKQFRPISDHMVRCSLGSDIFSGIKKKEDVLTHLAGPGCRLIKGGRNTARMLKARGVNPESIRIIFAVFDTGVKQVVGKVINWDDSIDDWQHAPMPKPPSFERTIFENSPEIFGYCLIKDDGSALNIANTLDPVGIPA